MRRKGSLFLIFLIVMSSIGGKGYCKEVIQPPDITNKVGIIDHFENEGQPQAVEEIKKELLPATYRENNELEDFEVHFFISLPFTALYSYLAVSSLDAIVQGQYPTAFRTSNTWMIIGLAIGTSTAIALGSIGRVPDQSLQNTASELNWNESVERSELVVLANKMEFLKILY